MKSHTGFLKNRGLLLCANSVICVFFLVRCSINPESRYFEEAQSAAKQHDWPKAVNLYEKITKVLPDSDAAIRSAREGAKICNVELKDFKCLASFLRYLVSHSANPTERAWAQKLLGETYLDKLNDYKTAVEELNRAFDFISDPVEKAQFRLQLARAYFYLNQYFQARSEIDMALRENIDQETAFHAKVLKANTYQNEKKFDEAISIYQKLIAEFPEKSRHEQLSMSLSVCYEEKEDFQKAIDVLEKSKHDFRNQELLEIKINQLKNRLAQAPGAKGLHK